MGRSRTAAAAMPCAAHAAAEGVPCSTNDAGRAYYCPARRRSAELDPYPPGPSGPSGTSGAERRRRARAAERWTSRRARARLAAYLADALDPDEMAELAARALVEADLQRALQQLREEIAAADPPDEG